MAQNIDWQDVLDQYYNTVKAQKYSTEQLREKFPEFNGNEELFQAADEYVNTVDAKRYTTAELQSKFPEFFPDLAAQSNPSVQQTQPIGQSIPEPPQGSNVYTDPVADQMVKQYEQSQPAQTSAPTAQGQPMQLVDMDETELKRQMDIAFNNGYPTNVPQVADSEQQFDPDDYPYMDLTDEELQRDYEMLSKKEQYYKDGIESAGNQYGSGAGNAIRMIKEWWNNGLSEEEQTKLGELRQEKARRETQEIERKRQEYESQRLQLGASDNLSSDERALLAEVDDLNNKTKKLVEAPSRYGKESGIANWAQGLADTFNDSDLYTLGIEEIVRSGRLASVANKLNEGKELSNAEWLALQAYLNYADVQQARQEDLSRGYTIGQGTAQSVPFIAEMLLSAGLGAIGKKALVKLLVSKGKKEAAEKIAKALGGTIVDGIEYGVTKSTLGKVAKEAGETVLQTSVMPHTWAGVREDQLDAALENREYGFTDFMRSYTNGLKEVFTERAGGKLIEPIVDKVIPVGKIWGKRKSGQYMMNDFINSPIGETGEEYLGALIDLTRSYNPLYSDESNQELRQGAKDMFTAEGFGNTFLTILPMSVLGGTANAIRMHNNAKNYAAARSKLADVLIAQGATEEEAQNIVTSIESSQNNDDFLKKLDILNGQMMANWVQNNPTATTEENQKFAEGLERAMTDYLKSAYRYNGTINDLNENFSKLTPEEQEKVRNTFDEYVAKYNTQDQEVARVSMAINAQANTTNDRVQSVMIGGKDGTFTIRGGNLVVDKNENGELIIDKANSDDLFIVVGEDGNAVQVGIDKIESVLMDERASDLVTTYADNLKQKRANERVFPVGSIVYLQENPTEFTSVSAVDENGFVIPTIDDVTGGVVDTPIDNETAQNYGVLKLQAGQVLNTPSGDITIERVMGDGNYLVNVFGNTHTFTPIELAETLQRAGFNAVEYQNAQAAAQAEAQVQEPAQPRYPLDKNGNPDFVQIGVEQSLPLINELGEDADLFVENNLKQAQKAFDKAQKKKPTSTNYNEIKQQRATITSEQEATKQALDYWTSVQQARTAQALQALQEIERAEQEAVQTEQTGEQQPYTVGEPIVSRWNNAPKVDGRADTRTLPNGKQIKGRYVLVEDGVATPSHNPMNMWETSQGFPLNEQGQNVNDRDYKSDTAAQIETEKIARNYGGQAVEQVPTVSQEGVVYDGNGRVMAGQIAAYNNTDGAYIEALKAKADMFGFAQEQIDGMQHPRVLFVADEMMPYNTETFAQFNANEKKTQNATEQAVAQSKKLNDKTVREILSIIDGYETLQSFFASERGTADVLKALQNNGIISSNEIAGMTEETNGSMLLNDSGREFVTNVVLGAMFDEKTIRQMGNNKALKQSVLRACSTILENRQLGEYSLKNEIANAISLLYEARIAKMSLPLYLRQTNMFDGNVRDRYSDIEILYAEKLDEGIEKFREVLGAYNKAAKLESGGQQSMFGVYDKQEIINQILDKYDERRNRSEETRNGLDVVQYDSQRGNTDVVGDNITSETGQQGSTDEVRPSQQGESGQSSANGGTDAVVSDLEELPNNSNENVSVTENNSLPLSGNTNNENNGTVSESIPQGEYGAQTAQDSRIEETTIGHRERIAEYTRNAQANSNSLPRQVVEARAAETYAKENGLWTPFESANYGIPLPSGNENDVYLNTSDNKVYKVNNLMNSKGSILNLFDRVALHNQTFPDSKYTFVGFTGFDGRSVYPVFSQDFIDNAIEATPDEIDAYMQSLRFKKTGDYTYYNGDLTISDLRPRNVLKDAEGDIYVIDADFKKEAQQTTSITENLRQKAEENKIEREAKQTSDGYSVERRYHKKNGTYIHAVKFIEQMPREEFTALKNRVKEFGGYYSSFGKGGFIFDNEEDAHKFAQSVVKDLRTKSETTEIPKQEAQEETTHKLVTDERYAELKARMRQKLGGQLNVGIDPEILAIGMEMAVYHIEGGARKFARFAKAMIKDLGDAVRPYLKAFYNGARDLPEVAGYVNDMDSYDEVGKIDVSTIQVDEQVQQETKPDEQPKNISEQIISKAKEAEKKKNSNLAGGQLGLFDQEENTETTKTNNNGGIQVQHQNNPVERGTDGQRTDADGALGRTERSTTEHTHGNGVDGSDNSHSTADTNGSRGVAVEPTSEESVRNTNNNHIERGKSVVPKTNQARYEANIAAIKLMKQLVADGVSVPNKKQMAVLRQYSGWGGLGGYFEYSHAKERKELRELLTESEFNSAAGSANSAYYTPAYIIDYLWDIAEKLGFKGGKILEGSAGIGSIIGQMPTAISERSNIQAVEIDDLTGNMLRLLYPDAQVDIQGFQDTKIRNGSVDLAITNVPFITGFKVTDTTGDQDLSKLFGSIHDFCIAKNVRKLKEGGIGIFISSNGTLDSHESNKLRSWLTKDGSCDVIGAFRLNNETFGDLNTDATSDIIIVRKRTNGQVSPNAIDVSLVKNVGSVRMQTEEFDWKTRSYVTKDVPMFYNDYFVEHPENMGGKMAFGFEHGVTRWGGTTKGCYPETGIDQNKRLKDWIGGFSAVMQQSDNTTSDELERTEQKEGTLFFNDKGQLCVSQYGEAAPVDVKKKSIGGRTLQECLNDYNDIKTALDNLLQEQLTEENDANLEDYFKALNDAYDKFVSRYGRLNKNVSLSWLRKDVRFPDIQSLEVPDKDGYRKSDIFTKRVVTPFSEPTFETAKDGAIASQYKYGYINVPYIADKLAKSENDVTNDLLESRAAFRDPINGGIVIRYDYLSGNVREKLRQAQENNKGGEYRNNIEELEKVVPMDIPSIGIDFNLGANWVPSKVYDEFFKEVTGIDQTIHLNYVGGMWTLGKLSEWTLGREKNQSGGVYSEKCGKWVYASDIFMATMNLRTIMVSKQVKHYNGETETIRDEEATKLANQKIEDLKDQFKEWWRNKIQQDEALSKEIEQIYNDKFNNFVPKEVDATFLPDHFANANKEIKLYPHQQRAIVRALSEPLMLAHEVGSGKTFTLISTAMEMRRIGTAKKPMIVVQNATAGQFLDEAKKLYPNAKVLSYTSNDEGEDGRKAFFAKIKYNDWDLVIVPQSVFDKIPDSEARMQSFIQEKIDEKLYVLEQLEAQNDGANTRLIYDLKKQIEDLESGDIDAAMGRKGSKKGKSEKKKQESKERIKEKAKAMMSRSTDEVQDFDDMGVDALLVDEAHLYKKLGFETAMKGVKGVDTGFSKRAVSLYLKSRSVMERTGGKNVVFATGTPITNTAAELWTFMRYLTDKRILNEEGLAYFDDFVRNFGNVSMTLEFNTSGKFKEQKRFAGYQNLPELVRLWSRVSDTVLSKDVKEVNDKLPEMETGGAQDIFLPQSNELAAFMAAVRQELEKYEKMTGKEKRENSHIPITAFTKARSAAIDVRLQSSGVSDNELYKTNRTVLEILRSLDETKDYKGTVAVFCDRFQNKKTGFNVFEVMREKLIAAGVPAEQIVIMDDKAKAKGAKIFEAVNNGDVRVIMGTTARMGIGVNIQKRLHTLIHMDAPLLPADYTQRNGRILRQGNMHKDMNKPVRILRMGVEDSLDVTSYQLLKTKDAFIGSIMDSKHLLKNNQTERTIEENEEGIFDNPVAMLSGSQYALLKQQAERELRKLKNRKASHIADQSYIVTKTRQNDAIIRNNKQLVDTLQQQLDKVVSLFPNGTVKQIIINGNKCTDEAQVAKVLSEKINKIIAARRKEMEDKAKGAYYLGGQEVIKIPMSFDNMEVGAKVTLRADNSEGKVNTELTYTIPALGVEDVKVGGQWVSGIINDITNEVVSGTEYKDKISALTNTINRLEAENQAMNERRGKPFAQESELAEAEKRVDEYTELMRKELADKEAKYANVQATEVDLNDFEDESESADEESTDFLDLDRGVSGRYAHTWKQTHDIEQAVLREAKTIGADNVKLIYDINDITDGNVERKRKAYGWYNNATGEITIVVPNNRNVEEALKTLYHEHLGHKEPQAVFGKEAWSDYCAKIYNDANAELRKAMDDYAKTKGGENWSAAQKGEEYAAHITESGSTVPQGFWEHVTALFRELLRKAKMMIGVQLNEADLRSLMQEVHHQWNVSDRLAEEMQQIKEQAQANGTFMKAPNGNATKLNERNWLLTRTREFKDWFGDWDKSARIEKLRKSKPVEILGTEIEPSEDLKQYRNNAREFGKTIRGEYTNKDTNTPIIINRDSINEVLHHDGSNVAHIQSVAAIPQMIENSIYITSERINEEHSKRLSTATAMHYYVCGLNIGDVPYTAKLVVSEMSDGQRYYDHKLTQIEKGELLNRAELSSTVADINSPFSDNKDSRLLSILQTNSSKVVDENGEPLVVYHGTNNDFSAFEIKDKNDGVYFAKNIEEAKGYGNVLSTFLNIKKPFEATYAEETITIPTMKRRGFDGMNLYDVGYYIAFSPNQIKSATENESISDDKDIRFLDSDLDFLDGDAFENSKPVWESGESMKEFFARRKDWQDKRNEALQKDYNTNAHSNSRSRSDKANELFYDNRKPLENFQNWIGKDGVFDETMDAYNEQYQSLGRSSYFIKEFRSYHLEPLAKFVGEVQDNKKLADIKLTWQNMDEPSAKVEDKKNGKELTTREVLGVYAQAKDAQEAEEMGLPDRGRAGFIKNLGISHLDVIRMVESKLSEAEINNFWKTIQGANRFALGYQLNSGLIDKETFDKYQNRKYYVPERGWRERDSEDNYVKGAGKFNGDAYNAALVKAKGRESLAADPFAYIQSIAESAILSGEKNKTKLKFLNLCLKNELFGIQSGSFIVKKVWGENVTDPTTGEKRVEVRYGEPTAAQREHDAKIKAKIKKQQERLRYSQGVEYEIIKKSIEELDAKLIIAGNLSNSLIEHRTTDEKKQHEVIVVKDGQKYVVQLADEHLANVVNGNFPDWLKGEFWNAVNKGTRFMSSVLTQYNPEFALRNFTRDLMTSMISNFSEQGTAFAFAALKNIVTVQGTLIQYLHADRFGDKANRYNGAYGNFLREFFEQGAATGWSYMQDIRALEDGIDDMIKHQGVAGKTWQGMQNVMSYLTELSELTIRFSQYVTARQMGKSAFEAAKMAKEVSTNFDRKGLIAKGMNILWSFFNASMQGSNKIFREFKNHKFAYGVAVPVSLMALGLLNTLMQPDDPDEERMFSDYERMSNIVIKIPIIGQTKIPLAHFFSMFWAVGVNMGLAAQGRKSAGKAMFDAVNFATSEVLPEPLNAPIQLAEWNENLNKGRGGAEWNWKGAVQHLAPTVIKPISDLALNRDFKGDPIVNEPFVRTQEGRIKNIHLGKKSTPEIYTSIARGLNRLTGGNPDIKSNVDGGWIDVNPTAIQYLLRGTFGGVGEFLGGIIDVAAKAMNDEEEVSLNDAPFLRKFVKAPYDTEKAYNREYYELKDRIDSYEAYLKDLLKTSSALYKTEKNSPEYEVWKATKKYREKKQKGITPSLTEQLMQANEWWNRGKVVNK